MNLVVLTVTLTLTLTRPDPQIMAIPTKYGNTRKVWQYLQSMAIPTYCGHSHSHRPTERGRTNLVWTGGESTVYQFGEQD